MFSMFAALLVLQNALKFQNTKRNCSKWVGAMLNFVEKMVDFIDSLVLRCFIVHRIHSDRKLIRFLIYHFRRFILFFSIKMQFSILWNFIEIKNAKIDTHYSLQMIYFILWQKVK